MRDPGAIEMRGRHGVASVTLILSFGIFFVPPLQAAPQAVQRLETTRAVVSLVPDGDHGWWATPAAIDPMREFQRMKEEDPDLDASGPEWIPVGVPKNLITLEEPGFESGHSEYWLRKLLFVPDDSREPLAVRLGIVSDRDRLFVNGVLVGSTGRWDSTLPEAYDRDRLYVLPDSLIRRGEENLLLMQVQGYFSEEAGITKGTAEIGPAEIMIRDAYLSRILDLLFLACYFTVGSYFLFLFVRRRRERENLYFGLFAYALVVYQLLRNQIKYELGIDFLTMKRVEYLALAFMAPAIFAFVRNSFDLPERRWVRGFDVVMVIPGIVAAALAGIVLFTDDVQLWSDFNNAFYLRTFAFYAIGFVVILVYGILQKEPDAWYMLFGVLFFVAAISVDTLSHLQIINFPRILSKAFILFVLILALILANRFVRLNIQVEDLNRNLERKVSERTEALNNTLAEVRELKEKQDGDYFLTSLLIRPLAGNNADSEIVTVRMLAEQMKKFTFRHRHSEIGGDMNIAERIFLRGVPYTVILNADAMGKSIQGAGGALVLGTVFKSIVNRTRASKRMQERFPEQWLKQAFVELQDVFVSFDGYMLISLVIMLLDESSGLAYYVNAEHPWVVLYRNGKARFIENELALRKIGVEGLTGHMIVKTQALEPGDILVLGSDGRDDLLLGHDDNGQRIINERETEFLNRVEEGEGDPEAIRSQLLRHGELTDDLSLVSVAFREDAPWPTSPAGEQVQALVRRARQAQQSGNHIQAFAALDEALTLDEANAAALRSLFELARTEGRHELAASAGRKLLEIDPGDNGLLFETSRALLASGEHELAADYAERLRLRDHSHVENLLHLAGVYLALEMKERARMILDLAFEQAPDSEAVRSFATQHDLRPGVR